ncbi:MotA/TolQ/ExbB proton channel family protein [Scytonema hofmannii FACHB-248]|uniref:MotA/TolQ/ExbB proton channel family protein n=1 Tax=Scytonema hofmannii FACHB-248 TaxID=1842502 RepID=A0ABR8GTP6_9CYAN|nr:MULTISPECIES: MotA/TolQ/ExbB proton channel family protein [Nostocales]MBD2606440.1 MotA/TolQ/ExbB proton channel family protein [Scytonema hofmannii FACHB-248]
MTRIYDILLAGGFVMFPLLVLFVITFACAIERCWFWFKLIIQEKQIVQEVLSAARLDLEKAEAIASRSQGLAIGRFLLAPLRLRSSSPEIFHLAIKASCDKECIDMYKGDKVLESVMAIAPLLGILGTSAGLFTTFQQLRSGQVNSLNVSAVASGIAQALIASATGMSIAILSLVFLRIFIIVRSRQINYFSQLGCELELIYLEFWHQSSTADANIPEVNQEPNPVEKDAS